MNKLLLALLAMATLNAAGEAVKVTHVVANEVRYEVVELDPKLVKLNLYWKNADGQAYESIANLRAALGDKFLMGTNSGIYSKEGKPLGLHVEKTQTLVKVNKSCASSGNFFKCPNGIFMTTANGGAKVIFTSEYERNKAAIVDATQSGPILVRNGNLHPKFIAGSKNKKLRSGVGVNAAGHVFFAISEGTVDFYSFAVFFRDTLHCPDALYLDGTISVLTVGAENPGQLKEFVGMWAATK